MSETDSNETQISTRDLPDGHLIAGRYEIKSALGTGGMGTVYKAKDRVLGGEPIAIKILRNDLVNDVTHTRRFLREVQLMRRVNHKNVVRTFDVGVDGSLVYFTMECVPGTTLSNILEKQSFTTEELGHLVIQIVEGLDAVHQQNIIHRDLKPGNIIVLPDNTIKIADFGVARPEYSDLTAHNEVIGSSAYMAPETWQGKPPAASVDYYSLGVILYEIVTGTHPFKADSPAALMRLHLETDAIAPREINKSVLTWVNRLIMRLLDKSPNQRMCDPAEIIDYVTLQIEPQSERTKSSNPSSSTKEPLVSNALLNRLEEMSQKAISQNENPTANMSGSFPTLASPATSLLVHRFWQKIPGSQYVPHALQVLSSQLVKGCIAALVLMVISVLLRLLIAGPVPREDSVLSLLLMQDVSNPNLRISSLFEGLSLFAPHCVVFLIVALVPATFLFAMAATWEHLFRSLGRLTGLYCAFLFIFLIWNAYPELRHGELAPSSLVAALSASLIQLTHVLTLAPSNIAFESALTSNGFVISSSAKVPLLAHPLFLACTVMHLCFLAYLALASLGPRLKRLAVWQSVTAVSLAIMLVAEGQLHNFEQSAQTTLALPTFEALFGVTALRFGLLHWGLLIAVTISGLLLTCLRGNIVFGRSSRSQ